MRKIKRLCWLVLIVVLALGCSARQGYAPGVPAEGVMTQLEARDKAAVVQVERVVVESETAASDDYGTADLSGAESIERKIIYNVNLHLIVRDTEETFAEVQQLTQEMGGFVADSNVWRSEGHRRATITVRVPVNTLEDALKQFRALALDVENEVVDSQDVTADYVDLEARLTNEQRTETELQELLETRSELGKTEDILEVHRELSRVRAEIESIQGRMRYLDNLSDMATVQITLTPDELMQPVDIGGWKPQGTARDAARMLLKTLQFFADAAIIFGIYILPTVIVIAIPIAILVLIIRAIWRWARRRKRARAA